MRADETVESPAVSGAARVGSPVSGILVLDKPEGLLSFAMVSKVRRMLSIKKAGHCGTLDPFATGVLVICLNRATRIADQLLQQDKRYRCTVRLGVQTDTLDKTGRVTKTFEGGAVGEGELQGALESFRGSLTQQTPLYSAARVQGKRLYECARAGVAVDLPEREVRIFSLELLGYEWPEAVLEVHCSKGTYIRQLAADLGEKLGCGAHVSQLRRLSSGPFHIEDALSLEELEEAHRSGAWTEKVISPSEAVGHLPFIVVENEETLGRLRNGHSDPAWESRLRIESPEHAGPVRLVDRDNRLVALWWPGRGRDRGRRLRLFE
jgi:tRNA pseudouridine55 synthase